MEAISSANKLAKPISVLDAVSWIADVKKQISPQTLQRCSQKSRFSTNNLNDEERNGSKSRNFRRHSITKLLKY
jgi:hypothetical protein